MIYYLPSKIYSPPILYYFLDQMGFFLYTKNSYGWIGLESDAAFSFWTYFDDLSDFDLHFYSCESNGSGFYFLEESHMGFLDSRFS